MSDKKIKACSGFGHREVFEIIDYKLTNAIDNALAYGCTVFYTGAMGKFDELFSSVVRLRKKTCQEIKLICVKPYMTKEINEYGDYLYALYDDIIIPTELAGVHYKSAIKKRNRWLVDHSDFIIGYTIRNYGGAYEAIKYAMKSNKIVVKFGNPIN